MDEKLEELLKKIEQRSKGQRFVEVLHEVVYNEPLEEGLHAHDVWELMSASVDEKTEAAVRALGH